VGQFETAGRVDFGSTLKKLSVGPVELPRPIFTLHQERGFGGGAEPDGLLCPGFLRRFKLIFDYPHQKLILEPGSHFGDEMPFDSSGLMVWRQGEAPYRVTKVIEDSPASEAGLRQGDIVLEVDGKPAGRLSYAEISNVLMADGRECQLRIRRGEDVSTVKLKLRRLI
jgi:membrane-associated protease RseP (regulator of RpoE activity)